LFESQAFNIYIANAKRINGFLQVSGGGEVNCRSDERTGHHEVGETVFGLEDDDKVRWSYTDKKIMGFSFCTFVRKELLSCEEISEY
jgi:hypothetical protein